jgi:galactokinase
VDLPLHIDDPASVQPGWGRYVAAVIAELEPAVGFDGTVTTDLPVGAGLSSSAALELAVALALGFDGSPRDLAELGQRAEHRAVGVPCGVMDQLTSASGVAGHALLLDCTTLDVTPVPLPDELEVVAVHSGEHRTLAGSAYAERRAAVEAAELVVGPLREVTEVGRLDAIDDAVLRRRARHVVTENQRVRDVVAALVSGRLADLGPLLADSHASLADDFEVSTPRLDELVAELVARPGVLGARLTGAGFGGCVVALCRPGTLDVGWRLRPSAGARRLA